MDDIEILRDIRTNHQIMLQHYLSLRAEKGTTPTLRGQIRQAIAEIRALSEAIVSLCFRKHDCQVLDALQFYADPETYFAIAFIPDPPAGEFMDDFSETICLGRKPGKTAREVLEAMDTSYLGT